MSIEDRKVSPVTPGEILADILEDNQITLTEFARMSRIEVNDLRDIIDNKKPITQDTALAIGKALFMDAQIWLNLQTKTDNWHKRQ
jgi:addiction module HigA family antidote